MKPPSPRQANLKAEWRSLADHEPPDDTELLFYFAPTADFPDGYMVVGGFYSRYFYPLDVDIEGMTHWSPLPAKVPSAEALSVSCRVLR